MAPHSWRSLRKGISRPRRPALFGRDLTRYTKPRNLEPIPIAKHGRNTSSAKERAAFVLRNLGKSECEMPSRTEADCSRPAFLGRENGDDSASGDRRVSQTRAAQPLRATTAIAAVPRLSRRKTARLWAEQRVMKNAFVPVYSAAARQIFLCGKALGHDCEVRQV